MKYGIQTLDDFDVRDKTVICRVDLNQPVNKETDTLKDITRIQASIPTLKELSEKKAKVVIVAHQGSDIEYNNFYSLRPHSKVLSRYLGEKIHFIEDICGPSALQQIQNLKGGELLLLENIRFLSEEQTIFEQKLCLTPQQQADTLLVRKLAPLADLYVCDAFAAAHRSQPSLCGFEQVLPSSMGRLFEKEYQVLSEVMEMPARPCVFVLGGAKIGDAFTMMDSVLSRGIADMVLTGGLAGNIMLIAKGYNIGSGSMDFIQKSNNADYIEVAAELDKKYGNKIIVPDDIAYIKGYDRIETPIDLTPPNVTALDIGTRTYNKYTSIIREAKTVFVNGPMGVFEKDITGEGTKMIWDALAATDAFTVVGGGDSITATKKYHREKDISYICTGGGALIRFLSGEELPAVAALRKAAEKYSRDISCCK